MLRLSICIPTHDGRAAALDRLLGVIEGQLDPGMRGRVEVCVSDNGSRDATTDVLVRRRTGLEAPLITHRFEHNLGFTPNLLKVMEIASGDFCWLVGSDDLIIDGAIAEVLALMDKHPDATGITTNRFRVNFFEPDTKLYDPPCELPVDPERPQVYEDVDEAFVNVGLLHDYISTQIVARELFRDVVRETSAEDLEAANHFAHLLLLGRMVQKCPRWMWYPGALVQHTTGTSALDEQLDHDYTAYQLAVMDGRHTVWSMLFGPRSPLYRRVMAKAYLRTASRPSVVVGLKLAPNHSSAGDLKLLAALVRYFFWHPAFWLRTMPFLLLPHQLIKALSRLKRRAMVRLALYH